MSQRIELSNSAWADLREPETVSVRLRRPVEKALMAIAQGDAAKALEGNEDLSDETKASQVALTIDLAVLDQFNDLNDLLVLSRLEAWSFDTPISLEAILDLPDVDYKALQKASSTEIFSMLPNFGISDAPDSPIKPSDV